MFFWKLFPLLIVVEVKSALGDSVKNTFFSPCSRSSSGFEKCIQRSIMELKSNWIKGIPEIGLPKLEPMSFTPFEFEENNQHIRISASFNHLYLEGLSNMTVEKVKVSGDVNTEMTINLTVTSPVFRCRGKWSGRGTFLHFNINGGGRFEANLTQTHFKLSMKGSAKINENNGKKYFSIHSFIFEPVIRKAHVYTTGLFPDNNYLNLMGNKFLNRNMMFILRIMKGYQPIYIGPEFEKIVKTVFGAWPIDELMLD